MKRKHVRDSKTCDLCEKEFETVREMKMHRYTHLFEKGFSEQKCVECDFTCKTVETMEVYIGKCCYDYFECGLCEARVENLEKLELHLTTCEIYECDTCFVRDKSLSDMKNMKKEKNSII